MPDESSEVFRVFSDAWQRAMDKKDFHDAVAAGIATYLFVRQKKNEQIARGALNLIYVAIQGMLESEGEAAGATASCSFCGRSESETRLGAGSDTYICADCVEIFHQTLKPKE
jgi:hypothetical protein